PGKKPGFNQEPRIKRILDPMTEYPDNACIEPDFSDAKWWFSRQWVEREGFKKEYGRDPVPFDGDADPDWAKETQVCIAEYWHVETIKRRYVALEDGTEGYEDELGKVDPEQIVNERDAEEREVILDIIDGQGKLRTKKWVGQWIPRIAFLGREVVVDGRRYLISLVRYAHGAQKLKNGYKSAIANLLGRASTAPWTGPKGTFKDKRWQDSNGNYATLEWDPVTLANGQIAPEPRQNTFEAPIQSLSIAARDVSDDIKRAVGYSDAVVQPSKSSDLSGVAVDRRSAQVDLTNFHLVDNLKRSQWHCARVVLDLDLKLADTPRVMRGRKEDGSTFTAMIATPGENGAVNQVPGQEGKPHFRLDIGEYDVTIAPGPSYNTKREEEKDILLQVLQANPAAWTIYGDLIFKLMGYGELEERARLTLPPAIQQAMQAEQKGIPPQAQAQIVSLTQRVQMLQQGLQKAIATLQSKQIEGETKLHVERLKTAGAVMVEDMRQRHDATKEMHGSSMEAVKMLMELLHESELGATPGPGMGNNALPEPVQPQGKAAA
ncbi:MAG: hypothetical protein JWO48_674, partial [Bryobacterales bacterium]|nr:hypothetical protein [Bryobacterales bacterium]